MKQVLLVALLLIAGAVSVGPIEAQTVTPRVCSKAVVYDASTNGATQLVAAGNGIYICGYTLFAAGSVNVNLGFASACTATLTALTPAYRFTTQTGITDPSPYFRGMFVPSGNALCINTSAGIAVQAVVYFDNSGN